MRKQKYIPGSNRTTGHHGRTVAGTLLTTRDTAADKEEALGLELLSATDGVGEVGVASVDDDITGLEEGQDLGNEVVDGRAGLDQHHDLARTLQLLAELLDRVSANNLGALGLVGQEVVNLGNGSVVGTDGEAMIVHVQDQVLALFDTNKKSRDEGKGVRIHPYRLICAKDEQKQQKGEKKEARIEGWSTYVFHFSVCRSAHTITAKPIRPMSALF